MFRSSAEQRKLSERARASIVFHGLVVFTLGILAGFPYGTAVTSKADPRAWHMAHLEGFLNGLFLIAIGACGALLYLSRWQRKTLYAGLLLTGYGNAFGAIVAAYFNVRGLSSAAPLPNALAFWLFMAAALGVLVVLAVSFTGLIRVIRSDGQHSS